MYVVLILSLIFFEQFTMGLCSLFFVLKAANNSFSSKWANKLLSHKYSLYLGSISYGLYVYHVPIIYYMTPYVFDPVWNLIDFESFGKLSVLQYHSWIIKFPLYTGISIVIAELSYRYFEKPLLLLKDRFFSYS